MKLRVSDLKTMIRESFSEDIEPSTEFLRLFGKKVDFYGVDNTTFCVGVGKKKFVFEAIENEDDGYRSYFDTVVSVPDNGVFFKMPIARVIIKNNDDGGGGFLIIDAKDGHEWLRVGTENFDDYYPMFVFYYSPKIK